MHHIYIYLVRCCSLVAITTVAVLIVPLLNETLVIGWKEIKKEKMIKAAILKLHIYLTATN